MPPIISTRGIKLDPETETVLENEGATTRLKIFSLRHKHFEAISTEMLRVGDYGFSVNHELVCAQRFLQGIES